MTDNDLRVKVAELCGWTDIGLGAHWDGQRTVEVLVGYPPEETPGDYWNAVPDYPHDLNACHEMEKFIPDNAWLEWCEALAEACGSGHKYPSSTVGDIIARTVLTNRATARQRCEAFVKVMENVE